MAGVGMDFEDHLHSNPQTWARMPSTRPGYSGPYSLLSIDINIRDGDQTEMRPKKSRLDPSLWRRISVSLQVSVPHLVSRKTLSPLIWEGQGESAQHLAVWNPLHFSVPYVKLGESYSFSPTALQWAGYFLQQGFSPRTWHKFKKHSVTINRN